MSINRQKALDDLLNKLRVIDTKGNSDIDLIFGYLEKFFSNPSINKKGSKKLIEYEIEDDPSSLSKLYKVYWRKSMMEDHE